MVPCSLIATEQIEAKIKDLKLQSFIDLEFEPVE
jgi:hypothetical protein